MPSQLPKSGYVQTYHTLGLHALTFALSDTEKHKFADGFREIEPRFARIGQTSQNSVQLLGSS